MIKTLIFAAVLALFTGGFVSCGDKTPAEQLNDVQMQLHEEEAPIGPILDDYGMQTVPQEPSEEQ